MNYTVGKIRQALLDQGITEVELNNVVFPVATTDPHALLYIVIFNGLIDADQTFSSDNNDYISRTVQALQMFGDPFVVDLVDDITDRN